MNGGFVLKDGIRFRRTAVTIDTSMSFASYDVCPDPLFNAEIIYLPVSIGMRFTAGVCRNSGTEALLCRSQGPAQRASYGKTIKA